MGLNISAYYRLARFDKPVGTWLLLLPCWFGLALAECRDVNLYLLFGVGAIIMRAAGCVLNDIIDRDFDAEIERTKDRPVASGEISVTSALIFLALLLTGGMCVLVHLPIISIFLAIASVPLFTLYPFMKRITYWPQIFLGITFNMGVLIAYSAVTNNVDLAAWVVYSGCIFWTLGYDTIYAHQDKDDDLKLGVKSSALALGNNTKLSVVCFYFIFAVSILLALYVKQRMDVIPLAILSLAFLHMLSQVLRLRIDNPRVCGKLFQSNMITGLLVFITLFLASSIHQDELLSLGLL